MLVEGDNLFLGSERREKGMYKQKSGVRAALQNFSVARKMKIDLSNVR